MEKMKRPTIRFDGFSENWEQFSICESTNELSSYATLNSGYPLLTSSRTGLMMQNEYRSNITTDSTDALFSVVPRGACTYRHMSDDDIFHFNINELVDFGLVSKEYPVFVAKDGFDLSFIVCFMNSNPSFRRFCRENKLGGTRTRLYYNRLAQFCITFPLEKEQIRIGNCFSLLDKQITLAQQKYDKLLNFKKTMLEKLFPQNSAKVPEVRFAGFSEPWKRRKLGDMGTTYTGLSGKTKKDFGHGEGKFVTYMNVFLNPISDQSRTENVEIDSSQNEVHYGDVFFTTSSETPEEVGMASVWLENSVNTYLNSFCFGYRPTEVIDPFYMAYMLRSEAVRNKIIFLAQGISRYNISKHGVMEISVPIPELAEQKKIGNYFRQLDNLITLHQRKLEKLKNIKSALLENMFV